jgi:hypothetical protein
MGVSEKECVSCGAPIPARVTEHTCEFCGTVVLIASSVVAAPVADADTPSADEDASRDIVSDEGPFVFNEGGVRVSQVAVLYGDRRRIPLASIKAVELDQSAVQTLIGCLSILAFVIAAACWLVAFFLPPILIVGIPATIITWLTLRSGSMGPIELVVVTRQTRHSVLRSSDQDLVYRIAKAIEQASDSGAKMPKKRWPR